MAITRVTGLRRLSKCGIDGGRFSTLAANKMNKENSRNTVPDLQLSVTNASGTLAFTDSTAMFARFYRAKLLM